jgi:CubicO group peptidase (beta-lactamase class C family)
VSIDRRRFLAACAPLAASCASVPPRAPSPARPIGLAAVFVHRDRDDETTARGAFDVDAVIEVASLSKPVFAFTVVDAAMRGALDLDAPITSIAPPPFEHRHRGAVDRFDDPRLADVTPRMLLAHRAGLPNWSRDRPLAFEAPPGTDWSYSGEGYLLLQRAIERGRATTLDAMAREALFSPLGMSRSTFDPARATARAVGHDRRGDAVDSTVDAPNAATSLLSTARDLARFARRLVEAPIGDRVVDAMTTSHATVDADRRIDWGVGLALAAPEWIFHWGANPGVRALFVGSRRRGEALVVVTDSDAGMEEAALLARDRFGALPLLTYPRMYPPD